jgi:hypothetical protein
MDVARIEAVVRALTASLSRRGVPRLLASTAFGFTAIGHAPNAAAKKRGKKKRQKNQEPPAFNAFGCLDVGQKCRGRDALCCSGICDGKKSKRGERDKTRCVAHNTGGCSPEQDLCVVDANIRCGAAGFCGRTTGNAGFCVGQPEPDGGLACAACRKDADCTVGFGPGAACVVCDAACPETGGTLCAPPAA